jgi:hypothetical protein
MYPKTTNFMFRRAVSEPLPQISSFFSPFRGDRLAVLGGGHKGDSVTEKDLIAMRPTQQGLTGPLRGGRKFLDAIMPPQLKQ